MLLATLLLTGLAAGALCCLLALAIRQEPVWLMLPMAAVIGAFMRWQGRGAIVAATATVISMLYTEYLYAAIRMADMLGFPLRDTLFKMDWALAWQIMRGNSNFIGATILVLSPLVAVMVAVMRRPANR